MEVCGQFHATATLPPGKAPPVPIDGRFGGGGASRFGRYGEKQNPCPCWVSNPISPVVQLVVWSLYWLSRAGSFQNYTIPFSNGRIVSPRLWAEYAISQKVTAKVRVTSRLDSRVIWFFEKDSAKPTTVIYPSGYPSKFTPRPMLLNCSDRARASIVSMAPT
jgi:hypothetical protein